MPLRLGKVRVYLDEDSSSVQNGGLVYKVKNCLVDETVRNLANKTIRFF